MCNQVFDDHVHALEFIPECYKIQEMCDKAVNEFSFVFDSILD